MKYELSQKHFGILFVPGTPGVYLTSNMVYKYWDGEFWYLGSPFHETAVANYNSRTVSFSQDAPFQGLKDKGD